MAKKIVKFMLVLLMFAGICFSAYNFLALKSEAATVYWQKLEMGIDPVLGTNFIRCWSTGQACVTVEEPVQ